MNEPPEPLGNQIAEPISTPAVLHRRRPRARRALLFGLVGLAALLVGQLLVARLSGVVRIQGEARDAVSGAPVSGVVARAGSELTVTGPSGAFQLGMAPPWQAVSLEAEGYEPRQVASWPPDLGVQALNPRTAEVRVVDHETGEPLAALVQADRGRLEPLEAGRFNFSPARPGAQISASADGYDPNSAVFAGGPGLELRLAPARFGRVLDAVSGLPLAGATVLADEELLTSGPDGEFVLSDRLRRGLRVTAPGYRRLELAAGALPSLDVRLEPFSARGLYLTIYGVADAGLRGNALKLAESTEVNTVVFDVKGDRGLMAYPSKLPLARTIGANDAPTIPEPEALLADLRARGIYTIARIVVMKDDLLARNGRLAGLDVAVRDRRNGQVWVDGEGLGWVDPFRREVWDYNIGLAREAALLGFDEIQFDYIRFPTDPSSGSSVNHAVYSREPTGTNRPETIAALLAETREALRPLGVYLSIDIFGYACWRDDDLGIGHQLALLAPHVDYLSPMIYPSTFAAGLPGYVGYPAVLGRPYEVVQLSMQEAQERIAGSGALIRPWLQYFDDYAWATGRPYNGAEIDAQRRAAVETGGAGWLMWDPYNRYSRGGLGTR